MIYLGIVLLGCLAILLQLAHDAPMVDENEQPIVSVPRPSTQEPARETR